MHGHAAGIVAPVFQAAQAFEQDGNDVVLRHGADDATHGECSWFRKTMTGGADLVCGILDRDDGNRISIIRVV
jgi:hypothetical protein